jgi:glycosyltransferase involved in cell wall biosynthesis
MTPVSVVVLTFNSAATIGATLDSLAGLCDDVHVVDSGSTDATKEIVAAKGARLAEHPFENYGAPRNWN